MTETSTISLPEAASRLGVPVRVLRHAIRAGKIASPGKLTATSTVPADWVEATEAAVEATPGVLSLTWAQKVPPFARYRGTSAWRKYANRVREYNHFRAATDKAQA